MSGLMQILLLKVSAHITEQLGMAPGGEFREAFKEVRHCRKVGSNTRFIVIFLQLFCPVFFLHRLDGCHSVNFTSGIGPSL